MNIFAFYTIMSYCDSFPLLSQKSSLEFHWSLVQYFFNKKIKSAI